MSESILNKPMKDKTLKKALIVQDAKCISLIYQIYILHTSDIKFVITDKYHESEAHKIYEYFF